VEGTVFFILTILAFNFEQGYEAALLLQTKALKKLDEAIQSFSEGLHVSEQVYKNHPIH
jgi:hypothetical protein